MKIKFARLVGLLVLTVFVSAQAVEMVPIQVAPGDQPPPMPAPPAGVDDFNNPPPPPVPPMAAPPQQNFPPPPAISAPPPSGALPTVATKPLKPGQMLFNFQDADIQAVVKTISQISGRNFLLDPRVKGKVT